MLPKNEVKYIQSLHHKKYRDEQGAFIAEGPKVVSELLQRQPGWVQKVYGTAEWYGQLPVPVQQSIVNRFVEIAPYVLEKLSALQTPQAVLAVASLPDFTYQEEEGWLLMLDGIQDPGNLGTILRTAHWFGIRQVVCSPTCADAFSPKVVQASMGSVFALSTISIQLPLFLETYQQPVYGAVLDGKPIGKLENWDPGCLVIGSEGRGISPEVLPFISQKITISGAGDAESLNAAVAAGILMQRLCSWSSALE
jgi:RNA methyltransferase, TrmH family